MIVWLESKSWPPETRIAILTNLRPFEGERVQLEGEYYRAKGEAIEGWYTVSDMHVLYKWDANDVPLSVIVCQLVPDSIGEE